MTVLHLGEDLDLETRLRPTEPLLIVDLLNDLEQLAGHLRSELERGSWLNAYLLAAGMNQVAEDHLLADNYLLRKAADHVAMLPPPLGSLGPHALRGVDSWRVAMRLWLPRQRHVLEWQADLASLVDQLADIVVSGEAWPSTDRAVELHAIRVLKQCATLPPALRRALVRLPSCFRSFDQRPEDVQRLVAKVIALGYAPGTPIASIGIRTSGSYLGPLAAACLRRDGFANAVSMTMRPGDPLATRDRRIVREVARRGGLVLLIDDPPTTGGSYDRSARELVRAGVASSAIVLLVPLHDSEDSVPAKIRHHRHLLLPWEEWAIHDQMTLGEVGKSLAGLVAPRYAVDHIRRVSGPESHGGRGHIEGRFRVLFRDRAEGVQSEGDVHVAGVGLGYLGDHSLAVAKGLTGLVPKVYGVHRGLMYRSWIAARRRLQPSSGTPDAALVRPFLAYVQARAAALKVPQDTSLRLRGRLPVWEVASNILSRAFGRAWAPARIPLVDPLVQQILASDEPSVTDGSMGSGNWFFAEGSGHRLLKVDFDRRAFSNLDLCTYDPAFDLASLAVDLELDAVEGGLAAPHPDQLRKGYAEMTGPTISEERWFLLQLVHLWDRTRNEPGGELTLSRALARASQRYFAESFFGGVGSAPGGRPCALDIDGVLETESLGFSSLTTSSAASLRALLVHGYRPLPVTGRSIAEVRERCAIFGLAGGVAEYGSASYDHSHGTVSSHVPTHRLAELARLRETLRATDGILIDDAYQHSIRAYRIGPGGARLAPSLDIVSRALGELGLQGSVNVHPGDAQIDIVAAGIDKASGLVALLAHLGDVAEPAGERPLALAVGDGPADIPVFRLADLSAAPAHAGAAVRHAAGLVTRRPYQAGLAQAAAALLGHPVGSCPVCIMPALRPEARAVMALVSAQERGVRSMVMTAVSLAVWNWGRASRVNPRKQAIGIRQKESRQW